MVTDGEGRILYVNRSFEETTGYSRQEVLGQSPRLLKSGWHDEFFYRRLWQTILSGQPFQEICVNRRKNGELYWAEQIISPIRDAEGQITHFLSVWRDVTARQQAEGERKRLAAILEATSDFVATATPDGRVLYYNRAARRMLGLADDEDIRSIRIPDTHPAWAARLVMEEAIPTAVQKGTWQGETALLSRDGREIPVSQVILAHKGPDGQVEYLSTIARDISEQKRLQAAIGRALVLERALRAIDAALLQQKPLQEVLEALCDGVVALGFRMCWVGLKEPDYTIRPLASRGLETDYVQAIRVRWDDSPLGRGPGGTAVRTGKTAVVRDTAADPSFEPWREEALQRGYRSTVSIPLRTNHEVLGILAVYAEQVDAFDGDSVGSLETLAQQGTLAIVTARQREELRRIQHLQDFHVEHMPLAHILWDTDFRVLSWNRAAERIFGWRAEEVRGRTAWEFLVPPEARSQVEAVWTELLGGEAWNHSINPNYRRDGSRILCEWFNTPLRDADGRVVAVASMAQDISEVDRLRAQAFEVERRFHDLAEAAAEGILIADTTGRVTYANPAAQRMFGSSDQPLAGQPVSRLLAAVPARAGRWEAEGVRLDGSRFPVEGSSTAIESRTGTLYTYVLRDLTERKRFEEQLAYLADHDPLTALFNRRRFAEELERELARARHYGEQGALLLVDLDRFKAVNDRLGHRAGDEVLVRVASLLRAHLPPTAIVARLGGDEFAVLLPRADDAQARLAGERILELLRHHRPAIAGQTLQLAASIGIACFPRNGASVDDLLVSADTAMYEAKEAGGNRVQLSAPEHTGAASAGTRLAWERRIRRALEQEGFRLLAQPILDLRSGQVGQYELLLRWVDEQGQEVLPGQFLTIAERSGLIREVDRWVVRRALAMLAEAARRGQRPRLEVNLSALALSDGELLEMLQQELAAGAVEPDQLILEITETAAIQDMQQARAFVEHLRRLGLRFALDDFGVGFGSFYYLKHLPVDYLKIDGTFIRRLGQDPVDAHVVRAIVELARGLGIQTIAECVEDPATLQELRRFGVDFAQGYSVGRPVPVDELAFADLPSPPDLSRPEG